MKRTPEWVIRYGIPAAVVVLGALVGLGAGAVWDHIGLRPASGEEANLPAEDPGEGIGRNPAVVRYLSENRAEGVVSACLLDEYVEGQSPVPEWWNPGEPMSAEWVDGNALQSDSVDYNPHPPIGIDPGGIDYNVCSTLWGWDGHSMEVLEMDVFSRVVYLEFWGTSPECCEAGVDAILRLWESGYYGETMLDTLSAVTETGGPVFETWDAVWGTEYDPEGLSEMRELCEERFYTGPVWIAPFFRTGHYHDWAVPCYEIDGVYFSTGEGWQ